MALRDQIRRHQRDNRWIIGALAVLLIVFTTIFYLLQRSRDLPDDLIRNRILVFALLYVNVVLILAVCFVLFRNSSLSTSSPCIRTFAALLPVARSRIAPVLLSFSREPP